MHRTEQSRRWLDKQGERLRKEQRTLREEVERESAGFRTTGTDHVTETGDVAEEEREDAEVAGTVESLESKLWEIDEALGRLAAGTYGRCVECDRDIPKGRLEAVPYVSRCRSCEERLEEEMPRSRREE